MKTFIVTYASGNVQKTTCDLDSVEAFCNQHFGSTWPTAQENGTTVEMFEVEDPMMPGYPAPPEASGLEAPLQQATVERTGVPSVEQYAAAHPLFEAGADLDYKVGKDGAWGPGSQSPESGGSHANGTQEQFSEGGAGNPAQKPQEEQEQP